MLESRAAYGYYGEGFGASGETKNKPHASGWHFHTFHFEITGTYQQTQGCTGISITACDYAHAMKQAKAWAKRDGFTIVGDEKGWESQRRYGA